MAMEADRTGQKECPWQTSEEDMKNFSLFRKDADSRKNGDGKSKG